MRELLIQFIVPLTFLAIWALTSILNRDGQPLPQRPQRPGEPKPDPAEEIRRRRERSRTGAGPAEGVAASSATAAARPEPRRPSPPPVPFDDLAAFSGGRPRPGRPLPSSSPPPVPAGLDGAGVHVKGDEVVFLDPATGRRLMSASVEGAPPAGSRNPAAAPRQRKAGRRRASSGESGRSSSESDTRRALSDQVGRAMEQRRNQSLELKPLAPKLQGLTTTLSQTVSLKDEHSPVPEFAPEPIFDAHSIQRMIAERGKLREIAVLTEILRPPVSLRRERAR